jgi:hypothetical protein
LKASWFLFLRDRKKRERRRTKVECTDMVEAIGATLVVGSRILILEVYGGGSLWR